MIFYFDEMMSRRAAKQLIERGYQVVLATDVGMRAKTDPEHLAFATLNDYIMVTFDRPFAGQTAKSTDVHGGLICLAGRQDDIGLVVRTLIDFADTHQPENVKGQVFWR
ncbi:MAG: hypothetical protein OHK0046_14530 [Anaerolineae bacterium]